MEMNSIRVVSCVAFQNRFGCCTCKTILFFQKHDTTSFRPPRHPSANDCNSLEILDFIVFVYINSACI